MGDIFSIRCKLSTNSCILCLSRGDKWKCIAGGGPKYARWAIASPITNNLTSLHIERQRFEWGQDMERIADSHGKTLRYLRGMVMDKESG